jgi:hypothetical protein
MNWEKIDRLVEQMDRRTEGLRRFRDDDRWHWRFYLYLLPAMFVGCLLLWAIHGRIMELRELSFWDWLLMLALGVFAVWLSRPKE